ncbi:MAG: hypothetical protein N6V41_01245, partial [Candidatus Portiera aleyrodidarum]|nr:hypothetical protein [Candidatus Portiera aleyrodidarum]
MPSYLVALLNSVPLSLSLSLSFLFYIFATTTTTTTTTTCKPIDQNWPTDRRRSSAFNYTIVRSVVVVVGLASNTSNN